MPSKKQNREYLRNEVIPHVREMAKLQEARMLRTLGTSYTEPNELIGHLGCEIRDDSEPAKPAVLDFGLYEQTYAKNCNIINDKYDCGRVGCLAGWYLMKSEQDRRFLPWDPQWTSIKKFRISDLARHFNISHGEAHDIFGSTGEGIERECLENSEYMYDDDGDQMDMGQIAVMELTQGEILEMRADILDRVMDTN